MNEQIGEYLLSSDEGLQAIGASLLDTENFSEEECKHWITEYQKRMMEPTFDTKEHEDSLLIMVRLNEKILKNAKDKTATL